MVIPTEDPKRMTVTVTIHDSPTARVEAVCDLIAMDSGISIVYKTHQTYSRPVASGDWIPGPDYPYELDPSLKARLYFAVGDEFWRSVCDPEATYKEESAELSRQLVEKIRAGFPKPEEPTGRWSGFPKPTELADVEEGEL